MSVAAGVAASLASAGCFGAASAVQHSVASRGDASSTLDPGLLPRLARQPRWLLGGLLELVAVGLQLVALRWAAVSLVQPLLVLGLPVGVLLAAKLKQQNVGMAEWLGLVLCGGGVAAVAALLPKHQDALAHPRQHAAAWMVGLLLLALAAGFGLRRSPVIAALGAGVTAGVGAAALAICGADLTRLGSLLTDWPPYVAVAGGVLALQLGQAAFQADRLGVPLATVTVAEPVTAVALSAALLREPLTGSAAAQVAAAVAVLAAVVGVVVVVRHRPPAAQPVEAPPSR